MKRREFITLLGGAAAWPFAIRAQQPERMRRIGVLSGGVVADDPDAQGYIAAFLQGLQQLVASGETGKEDGRENELKPFVAVQGVRQQQKARARKQTPSFLERQGEIRTRGGIAWAAEANQISGRGYASGKS